MHLDPQLELGQRDYSSFTRYSFTDLTHSNVLLLLLLLSKEKIERTTQFADLRHTLTHPQPFLVYLQLSDMKTQLNAARLM